MLCCSLQSERPRFIEPPEAKAIGHEAMRDVNSIPLNIKAIAAGLELMKGVMVMFVTSFMKLGRKPYVADPVCVIGQLLLRHSAM